MASNSSNFVWRPTPEQRGLYVKWKRHALGMLVSSEDGIRVRRFGIELGSHVEETIPLEKMGFPTVNHFLCEMRRSIEIRRSFNTDSLEEELLVFIKESHVPQNMKHMFNRQKTPKKPVQIKDKTGRPITMTKRSSALVQPLELLRLPTSMNKNKTIANFAWRPTTTQKKLFEEWKNHVLGLLVASKDGIRVNRLAIELRSHVEETIPLGKMGFPAVSHFLFEMSNFIEIQRWFNTDSLGEELLVFIKESHVPKNMRHIRRMVNRQANPKKPKRDKVGGPTKKNSTLVRPFELLKQLPSRPPQRPLSPPAPSTSNRGLSDFKKPAPAASPAYTFMGTSERSIPRHQQEQDQVKKLSTVSLLEHRPVENTLKNPKSAGLFGIAASKPSTGAPATQSQLQTVETVGRSLELYACTSRAMQGAVETVSMYPDPDEHDVRSGMSALEVVSRNSGIRTVISAPDGSLTITVAWNKTDIPRSTSITITATAAASAIATTHTVKVNDTTSTKPAEPYIIPQRDNTNTAAAVEAFTRSLRPAVQPPSPSGESIQMQSVGKPPSLAQPPQPLPKMLTVTELQRVLVQVQVAAAKVPMFNPSFVGTVCPRHSVENTFSFDNNNKQKAKFLKDLNIPIPATPSALPKFLPSKPATQLFLSLQSFMDYYMGKNATA